MAKKLPETIDSSRFPVPLGCWISPKAKAKLERLQVSMAEALGLRKLPQGAVLEHLILAAK